MTQMYYTIAMSLLVGLSVAFNQYGLAAFIFSMMVGTSLSLIVEKNNG